ncbi:MAG TPA: histidine phosphatase family protein [Trichocoleus sp.]
MAFSKGKQAGLVCGVLLSLVGCAGPPPQSSSSNPASQSPSATTAQPPSAAPEAIATAESATESDLWSRLQQADTHYYVLMRHAIAPGTGDPPNFRLGDCSTQRNLSEAGKAQARRTGQAFRDKRVPVRQVLSSEWCRCLETAELLNLGTVERFSPLNSFFSDAAKGPQQTEQLRKFMLDQREAQGITVMVTHFVNISAIAGSGVGSGEMVVMQINDQNQLEVVGRLEEL